MDGDTFELILHEYPIYATRITKHCYLPFVHVHKKYQNDIACFDTFCLLDPSSKGWEILTYFRMLQGIIWEDIIMSARASSAQATSDSIRSPRIKEVLGNQNDLLRR